MANKKEKLKIQKAKNELIKLEETIEKNKLEFANKLYQKLQIDYLDNEEIYSWINKLKFSNKLYSKLNTKILKDTQMEEYINYIGLIIILKENLIKKDDKYRDINQLYDFLKQSFEYYCQNLNKNNN